LPQAGGVTRAYAGAKEGVAGEEASLNELEYVGLAAGVTVAILFPFIVVSIHGRRERRRNRKAGSRRTDKIRL
jgi:hypothetical protein